MEGLSNSPRAMQESVPLWEAETPNETLPHFVIPQPLDHGLSLSWDEISRNERGAESQELEGDI